MTREEFVRAYAERYETTIRASREACYNVFEFLSEKIATEPKVYIIGLGTFKKQKYKAKRIRNVNTGEDFVVPETEKIVFTASESLGRSVADDKGGDED